jgi:hypothetical protein
MGNRSEFARGQKRGRIAPAFGPAPVLLERAVENAPTAPSALTTARQPTRCSSAVLAASCTACARTRSSTITALGLRVSPRPALTRPAQLGG